MKLNSGTIIVGKKVILVPYKEIHVPKYHRWMQREDLREATASEMLTEEDEYEMQKTWYHDEDKCTFIILDKMIMDSTKDQIEAMIGDVNLYLSTSEGKHTAECGIMIAENSARRQGKGLEALLLMLKYGCDILKINKFVAKISLSNLTSANLFEKIGFKMTDKSEIFLEATYVNEINDDWRRWLNEEVNGFAIKSMPELIPDQ